MTMKIAVGFPAPLHIGMQPVIVHNLKFFLTSISKREFLSLKGKPKVVARAWRELFWCVSDTQRLNYDFGEVNKMDYVEDGTKDPSFPMVTTSRGLEVYKKIKETWPKYLDVTKCTP